MILFRKSGFLYFFSVISLVASTFLTQPAQVYAQGDWREFSADLDGDGLPNQVEDGGWYDAAGGPFVTGYMDADSDDDGLTDGQEKLYDTDPLDDRSPGIFVEHQDHFRTKRYYPWQRYGSKYIALPTSGQDAVVVRRGTTFSVGGPAGATLQIGKSRDSLTTLTALRNPCSGRWDVSVPESGTVGIYTLRVRDGDWSKSLNLYVIFELPTGVSSAFTRAFVYDDDSDSSRDTMSVAYWEGGPDGDDSGWRQTEYTHADYPWIPEGEWITHGYTWGFNTQHFGAHVFKDYVMPSINGKSNTWDAANALGERVDEVTCAYWPNPLGSSWCVLHPNYCYPYKPYNECSNIARLLTAFNRSAGIASRAMWTDWLHSTFDHSTEVWTRSPSGGSTRWYVMRGYTQAEYGISGGCPGPGYEGGYNALRNTSGWYSGSTSQGVYSISEDWDNIYGGRSPQADKFRMASWDLNKAGKTGKIVKKSWFETRYVDYWGWPSEPQVIGSPPDAWPSPPSGGTSLGVLEASEASTIQFGQVVADYGIDTDGDGRFDELVFEFEAEVREAGEYWVRGMLAEGLIEAVGQDYLEPGRHILALSFEGEDIYMNRVDGPYTLQALWATDVENPSRGDFGENQLAYAEPGYQTAYYEFGDFGIAGATLSGEYNYYSLDSDGDGYADALVVETGLNMERAGTYTVRGVLFGGQVAEELGIEEPGEMLAQATWSGSDGRVSLRFEGLRDTEGPYRLAHVHVRNEADEVTDGFREPYELGELPEFGAKPVSLGVEATVQAEIGATVVITDGYLDIPVDTDADGQYDQLVIVTTVEVEPGEGGQAYRVEGWLVDEDDNLITWVSSEAVVLSEGVHTLDLAFDGRIIRQRKLDGPYKLVALKALPGDTYDVLNEVDVAYTTAAYSHEQFEEPSAVLPESIFEDDMESGTGKWIAESPWSLGSSQWYSYNHAWEADASGTEAGSLKTISLDLTEYVELALRFSTCYAMQSAGDEGYVEASTDGVEWTRLATYTDLMSHWSTTFIDLSDFGKQPAVQVRFSANSQDSLRWYLDDVYISGQSGAFTYLPLVLKK